MICPKCRAVMKNRIGKHGAFWYCPNQYNNCEQKTITNKESTEIPELAGEQAQASITRITVRHSNIYDPIESSNEPLMLEARLMEAQIPILFRTDPNDPPFVDSNGEIDWNYEDEADWWRPY